MAATSIPHLSCTLRYIAWYTPSSSASISVTPFTILLVNYCDALSSSGDLDCLRNVSHPRVSKKQYVFFHLINYLSDSEYLHLPDIQTVDGLLDLLSGCALAVLANVLDFRTYSAPNQHPAQQSTKEQLKLWHQHDRNNIPADERLAICYARGIALAVFRWIRECCIVKNHYGTIMDDVPSRFMVQLVAALSVYKSQSVQRRFNGAPHCTKAKLEVQIDNAIRSDALIKEAWDKRAKGVAIHDLKLYVEPGSTVQWKGSPVPFARSRKLDFS